MTSAIEIRAFDPQAADEAAFRVVHTFSNRMNSEARPDDPPLTLEEIVRNWRFLPEFLTNRVWFAWTPAGEIVAQANVGYMSFEENRHIAESWIGALPEWRRQGIATRLLRLVVDTAREGGRTMLMGRTQSTVPAGDQFLERIGAKMGMAQYDNLLKIDELNRELVGKWLERAKSLEGEFELGLWVGAYPEEDLEAVSRLETVMNTAPRGELQFDDMAPDPQRVRQYEASMLARGTERWNMYVRERSTSELVGYTEVYWNALQPDLLAQGDTGVFPQYRERGIGTWLKAAMLDKVLRERPQVRRVRTGNAHSNAPMLSINRQLGFRPYVSNFTWQVEVERVEEYLSEAGG